jgi:AcrR family transcriptional regulator
MATTFKIAKPIAIKRTVGKRAGLNRAKILDVAVKLWLSKGVDGFSIKEVARSLNVGTTTIHSHFKGATVELRAEIARQAIDQMLPTEPAAPAADELRALFHQMSEHVQTNKAVGHLVALHLVDHPFTSSRLAGRVLRAVAAITEHKDTAWAAHLVLQRLVGMLIFDCGG